MGQVPAIELPDGLLELMNALESEWPQRTAALRTSGVPLNESGAGDGGDGGDGGAGAGDGAAGDGGDGGNDPDAGLDAEALKSALKQARDDAAKHRIAAREATKKVKEYEDKDKSEAQKLQERADQAEQRATSAEATALRLEVALDKAPEGMPIAQVRKLAKRLTGTTKEELEADADELFADFAPSGDNDGRGSSAVRPKERLRPGAAPSVEPEETDPAKLAAMVPRPY